MKFKQTRDAYMKPGCAFGVSSKVLGDICTRGCDVVRVRGLTSNKNQHGWMEHPEKTGMVRVRGQTSNQNQHGWAERPEKKEMVPPDGETLNALFEVFADWDEQLRHSDFPDMTFDDDGPQP